MLVSSRRELQMIAKIVSQSNLQVHKRETGFFLNRAQKGYQEQCSSSDAEPNWQVVPGRQKPQHLAQGARGDRAAALQAQPWTERGTASVMCTPAGQKIVAPWHSYLTWGK